jgi:catechol 2,3-dioxygenase-like lactoylglutathione lyase family enzyme
MPEKGFRGKNLRLPNLGQVGVVVKDVEKAVDYYSTVFGIGPFDIYDFHPQRAWVNGKEIDPIKLKIAMADLGSVKLELIELIEAHGLPHLDFSKTHGEGLQHLGFYSENYEEWKSYAQEEGMEILCEAEIEDELRGRRRAFYMDSSEVGGVLFEIIEIEKQA